LALLALLVALPALGLVPLVRALRLSLHDLSLAMEAHFPAIESRLVTILGLYPQLERLLSDSERGFMRLAIESAHRDTVGADFREAVSTSWMRRLSAASGLLAAGILGFAALNPGGLMAAVGRFTGLSQEYRETHAQVSLWVEVVETDKVHVLKKAGEVMVAAIRGSDVQVTVQAQADVDVPLNLYWRPSGQAEFRVKRLKLPATSLVAVPAVSDDTEFYLSFGPARSETVQVRATDYPKVVNVQLRLIFPDYTRVRPEFIPATDGRIRALYKAKAEVSIQADKPLRRGTFVVHEQRCEGKVYGPRTSIGFLVIRNGQYGVEIVDADGFGCQTPFERSIECLADQPPVIEAYAPDEVLVDQASVRGVAVRFQAQDDYGIDKVRLVYQVGRLPGVRIGKERSEGARPREIKIDARRMVNMTLPCRFDELGLEVGEVVTYHLEVDDTDIESGPHTAKSKAMRLVVVGRELQDWIEIEDEDRWPTDFVGFAEGKKVTGLGKPGASRLVTDAAERPDERSAGVTNAAEGFVPQQLRQGFSDYSSSLKDTR
jgi:hypothetical protein